MEYGIERFKCSTLAEVVMVAACKPAWICLAYPLVGIDTNHFASLTLEYPSTKFCVLVDSQEGLYDLDQAGKKFRTIIRCLIDVNLGMNRTGVELDKLRSFTADACSRKHLEIIGYHCYDGHIVGGTEEDRSEKVAQLAVAFDNIIEDLNVPHLSIAGGSSTFIQHSRYENRFVSPGTVFVWDQGYEDLYPEMGFVPGAALLTRVISHPREDLLTIDLGYKSIASESSYERGLILEYPSLITEFQSEEHWTLRVPVGHKRPNIGAVLHVIPRHICPTTALYRSVLVVSEGKVETRWPISARDRLSFDSLLED